MKQVIENRTPLQRLLRLGGMAKAAGGKLSEFTASGNPCVFETDVARPLKRLSLSLLPRQSGTGDPSPLNIRPLLPWGEVGTWTGGTNIFVPSSYDWNYKVGSNPIYVLNADGSITLNRNDDRSWIDVAKLEGLPKGKYVLQWTGSGTIRMRYDMNMKTISSVNGALPFTIEGNNTSILIKIFPNEYPSTGNVQIVCGEEAKPYEPPTITPHPVNLGKNLYHIPKAVTKNGITAEMTANGEVWIHGTPNIQSGYISLDIGTIFDSSIVGKTVSASIDTKDVGIGFVFGSSNGSLNFAMSQTVKTHTGEYTRDGTIPGHAEINVNYNVGTIDKKYKLQFEVGDAPSTFQPYLPPVYGASIDLTTGEVWGTHVGKALTWGDGTNEQSSGEGYKRRRFLFNNAPVVTGSANSISDKCGYNSNSTAQVAHFYVANFDSGDVYVYIFLPNETSETEEITVVSKLQTPVLLATLTPQQVSALVGVNTVWSDADGVEVTYLKKG